LAATKTYQPQFYLSKLRLCRHTWLLAFSIIVSINLSAQTVKIDSLKKASLTLNKEAKVDCLNAIAWQFNFNAIHSDSALKYAALAYTNAERNNYITGKAVALFIQGDVQGRLLGNNKLMEKLTLQAIDLLKPTNDLKNLSTAYYKLAISYSIQGRYSEALLAAMQAKQMALKANDRSGLGWALEAFGHIYCHSGEYWKGFENMMESQRIGKEINDSLLTAVSLAFIARTFNRVGDPKTALRYYHQSLQYATPFLLVWPHVEDMAYAHLALKQYDSVLYYQAKHRHNLDSLVSDPLVRKKFTAFLWGYSADVQLARKQYDQVVADVLPQLKHLRSQEDIIPLMQSLLIMGKVYREKKSSDTALRYARELLHTARQTSNKQYLKEADGLLASLFEATKNSDSAYHYFKEYTLIKDSMETAQFAGRTALYLAASEAESKIQLLLKDQQISEQRFALNKKELARQGQLKNGLIAGLVILFLLFLVVIRNNLLRQKNEKLQHEKAQQDLKRKALELEMQALRAQMNPHFIFNCLSAIDDLIQTSQPDRATSYLARFASLIRGVLDSSKNNLVAFERDFETLRLYLELEQFRCNNKFRYELNADKELLDGDYKVPPLIIQPFVENAIHHGLLNKLGTDRELKITARLTEDHIIYSVTDNGIGRKQAALLKSINRPEHQSYGIAIAKERLQLHNRWGVDNDVLISDLDLNGTPTGTKAVLKIDSF
jgi:tetratricopeptide (TPR) repeat protein